MRRWVSTTLGTLLPELPHADRWRHIGRSILLEQLHRHVRPDGVYFEQSSYYHRYTTDFYMHFYLLAQANGENLGDSLSAPLAGLLDHLMWITCWGPDGSSPLFGDDDGGRLVTLDERPRDDFRATLSTGAVVFGRLDYKHVAGPASEETLWLQGVEGVRAYEALEGHRPSKSSRAFPDGGYFVMRDGWERNSHFMLVDCGPHGALSRGHAHADALSIDLAAYGRTLIVDPGTYTYTGSASSRDSFRSSAAHNTLIVDGEPSSVPAGPFSWRTTARCALREWTTDERFDFFEGEHDGYARLQPPATHIRSVLYIKGDYWIVRDRVVTPGEHGYELRFQFAPGACPEVDAADCDSAVRERTEGLPGLEVFTFGAGGSWREESGWVSSCYAARTEARMWAFGSRGDGPQDFTTFIIPRRAGQARSTVREVTAQGGRAYEVLIDGSRDMFLLGCGGQVRTSRLTSDGEWTWLRIGRESELPEEMLARAATCVTADGNEVIRRDSIRADWVYRRLAGDPLAEPDQGGAFVRSDGSEREQCAASAE